MGSEMCIRDSASSGILEIDPESLDWGEVDFHTEECMDCLCADGCGSTQILLTNTGEQSLTVTMPKGFDDEHLCIDGYTSQPNLNIGTLEPEEFFILDVAVCNYQPGELNLPDESPARPVSGSLTFSTDGPSGTSTLPFSFTPIRNQD